MSWKMTREVREARLAGQLPGINFTEFAVLFILAETCRGESREARITMSELVKLSGQERTSMSRAVKKLIDKKYIWQGPGDRGNQFQPSRYEILPGACGADATSTDGVLVAFESELVALTQRACGADATLPFSVINPGQKARKSRTALSKAEARALIVKTIDDCHDCDDYGRLDDTTDCPKHPNLRQYPEFFPRQP